MPFGLGAIASKVAASAAGFNLNKTLIIVLATTFGAVSLSAILLLSFFIVPTVGGGAANQALCSTGTGLGDGVMGQSDPSPLALKDIPAVALDAYRKIGAATGVDWAYLAAIGKIETQHGVIPRPSKLQTNGDQIPHGRGPVLNGSGVGGNTTPMHYNGPENVGGYDVALGPMQHLASNWFKGNSARDGNGDGKKDPYNIYDAVLASVQAELIPKGIKTNPQLAMQRYNGSGPNAVRYGKNAMKYAAEYRSAGGSSVSTSGTVDLTSGNLMGVSPAVQTAPSGATSGGGSKGDGSLFGSYGGWSRNAEPPAGTPEKLAVGMRWASSQVGKMYKWGGGHPRENDSSYDCSGLVSWALKKSGGKGVGGLNTKGLAVWLPANGKQVFPGQLMPGDIALNSHHTAIVWTPDVILEAPETGKPIKFSSNRAAKSSSYKFWRVTNLGAPDPGTMTGAVEGSASDCATGVSTGALGGSPFQEPGPWGGFTNGNIPDSAMTQLSWAPGHRLRSDAAQNLEQLNVAYKAKFGKNLCINDSYRSLAGQYDVARRKPTLSAKPGTSKHGWALAVDLGCGIESFGTVQYNWMKANAERYGFLHPKWAEPGGSKPEPWHWEFWGFKDGGGANPTGGGNAAANKALAQQMAAQVGWTGQQWTCLETVWQQESEFNHLAKNRSSGAYGIPQSYPGKKMASAGRDWQTNPVTQIKWGLGYIKDRYKTPCGALKKKYAGGSGGKPNGPY